jgi:hypothetical protein
MSLLKRNFEGASGKNGQAQLLPKIFRNGTTRHALV